MTSEELRVYGRGEVVEGRCELGWLALQKIYLQAPICISKDIFLDRTLEREPEHAQNQQELQGWDLLPYWPRAPCCRADVLASVNIACTSVTPAQYTTYTAYITCTAKHTTKVVLWQVMPNE